MFEWDAGVRNLAPDPTDAAAPQAVRERSRADCSG